ncbi:MAG: hypothetical protein ACT4P9_07335 [Betaproteobacteria bacterium]
MIRAVAAAAFAFFSAAVSGQEVEVLAPATGTEFAIQCGETGVSRWLVASNDGKTIKVERVGQPGVFRQSPVWAYILGDIYDELGLGTGRGSMKMSQLEGPREGLTRIAPGAKFRARYNWVSPKEQAERIHVVTVRGRTRINTQAFGEQDVYEIRDEISGTLHDNRRTVMYAPALRMYVAFSMKNNRSDYELKCHLASLKAP